MEDGAHSYLSTCGEILFGNGTTVEIVDLCNNPLVIDILGATSAVTLILIFILTCTYISRHSYPSGCSCGEVTEPGSCPAAKEMHGPEVHNLLCVDVSARNSRHIGRRDNVETECIYSAVVVAN